MLLRWIEVDDFCDAGWKSADLRSVLFGELRPCFLAIKRWITTALLAGSG